MAGTRLTLTISELEAVLLVAETRNFRMAAEHAHVSQPALSRRVQAAEQKLNAKLFDRDKHGVALTDAGPELVRSEEHTSELQSLMLHSYAVFCLKKKKTIEEERYVRSN